jgi:hypothetical protein
MQGLLFVWLWFLLFQLVTLRGWAYSRGAWVAGQAEISSTDYTDLLIRLVGFVFTESLRARAWDALGAGGRVHARACAMRGRARRRALLRKPRFHPQITQITQIC